MGTGSGAAVARSATKGAGAGVTIPQAQAADVDLPNRRLNVGSGTPKTRRKKGEKGARYQSGPSKKQTVLAGDQLSTFRRWPALDLKLV